MDVAAKKCICCGVIKELSMFYSHPAMSDGHLNKCKDCCKKHSTENRMKNIDRYREYDRNRPNKKERAKKTYERKIKLREEDPEKYDSIYHKARKNYRTNHREKYLANSKLEYALEVGKIIRPSVCSRCGIECTPQGHHFDYSKPLDVIWLCAKCHAAVHVEIRKQKRLNK
jgi:hypothetical protein